MMTRRTRWTSPLLLGGMLLLPLAPPPAAAQQARPAAVADSHLGLLRWRNVGPSRGGRVVAVAGDPVSKQVFYQGTTGGGVWRTDDGGMNWRNVSDGFFGTGSVGAIQVAPSDPNVVYVGMGEACIRGNATHGDGVYRSADAGKTWSRIGLEATRHISRVRVHPTDPNVVYVAALGDAFGPSAERGIFRTRDGGKTWQKVLYRNEDTGAIDLVMDPTNPRVLYASMLQLRRFPWGFRSAGPGTGLFKSTDGGDSWTEITDRPGLPTGLKGRIGIALSPARPERVWAIIDAEQIDKKGVYRSDDGGATWRHVNNDADLTQRPWYYHHIFADPQDPDALYVLNVGFWKSTDGGATFAEMEAGHPDHHDLWIDPQDPRRMIVGNDGGATVSMNAGGSWSTQLNQPTAQMYHVATDRQTPYRLYGAQQDNTTISVPSRSDYGRITLEEWYTVGGGEAGYVAPNWADPNIVYAADHHWVHRYDHRTRQTRDVSPNPETHYGWGSADINYRFWWTFPVVLSPHDPKRLYVTSQVVHRTTDEGQSWQVVSPDLTRHDPKTLEKTPSYTNPEPGEFWGPTTREAYGPEWYATIFAFAESPKQAGVLWAGSDDGLVHVSRDDGKTWANVTPPDLPEFALVSIIDPSPHDPAAAYLAATCYKLQDQRPYLYRTSDYGKTWTRIVSGIPEDEFTRAIREDPSRRGLLYAGTERGVWVSFDDGARWQSLRLNLPVVPVHDLVVQDGDLAIATHGRSFWILDNVALLGQMTGSALTEAVHLFRPRDTVRFRQGADLVGTYNGIVGNGENPPNGVVIPYHLRSAPTGPVTLSILREVAPGRTETVTTFTSQPPQGSRARPLPARAGANTFVWDMRYPAANVIPGVVFQGGNQGPLAPPGSYRVELKVDGRTYSHPFRLMRDPRLQATDADLQAQFDFLSAARDRLTATMDVVRKIREMRTRAEEVGARGGAEVKRRVQALNDRLYPLEESLVQYRARAGQDLINYPTAIDSKLARLMGFASMADAPPTQGQRELLERLTREIAEKAREAEAIERGEFASLVGAR